MRTAFSNDFEDFFDRVLFAGDRFTKDLSPFAMEETENGYVMAVDIPGVKKEDLKIEVVEQTLFISAERKRDGGKWSYKVMAPRLADTSKIEANLEDGVLEIAIPKMEAAKPRTVQIGSGSGLFAKLLGSKTNNEKHTA
ncbi:MAG: Hsp20/alpha crystallin family protein [Pseudobdellovibrionaceae bacterium]